MRRILFVDDEPRILDGLRRMLHVHRHDWQMVFAGDGAAALTALEESPFDVVVTDMRMPGMDGAALLTRVQQRFPDVARIVLSGHAELEAAMRAIPVAHQFLSKPCNADILKEVVTRACNLHAFLGSDQLRGVVAELGTLPSLPRVYSALMQALADPDAGLLDLAKIVEQDVAISAKLLQAVNSAFFGLPRRVASVQRAVSCLGVNLLKNLVLSLEVARAFAGAFPPGFSLEALQAHALLAANIARDLVPEKQHADDAFTAALLHDVGILVMATRMTEHLGRVLATVRESGRPMHQVEAELSGITHAQIGAYLLGLWGLPYGVVEAVAHHHTPAAVDHGQFDVVDVVHVASHLAHEQVASSTPHPENTNETLDVAHLERLGVADRLPAWRAKAAEHARRSAGDMA